MGTFHIDEDDIVWISQPGTPLPLKVGRVVRLKNRRWVWARPMGMFSRESFEHAHEAAEAMLAALAAEVKS